MDIVSTLEAIAGEVISAAVNHRLFALVMAPDTSRELRLSLIRNVLVRTWFYGDTVTEAVVTGAGRGHKTRPKLFRNQIELLFDELSHPDMARRDFLKLGGAPGFPDDPRNSPASFVVGSTARAIAEQQPRYSHLGVLAVLELTTPVLSERVMPVVRAMATADQSKFLPLHATVDVRHASEVKNVVAEVVAEFPDAADSIAFGARCFRLVYPSLIWDEALTQSLAEAAGGRDA